MPNDSTAGQLAGAPMLRSLERGLLILSFFDVEHPEWTFTDICSRARLPKATVFRFLKKLQALKYLAHDGERGTYHLGSSMLKAGFLALSHSELARIAHPHLQRLVAVTNEAANLAVWTDQGAMIVDTVLTSGPFKLEMPAGMFITGLASVHARIFLAFGPADEREAALNASQERFTESTIVDPQRLAEELARIKNEGVAYSLQEWRVGACAVGAPVFDPSGGVRASLAIVAPIERFGPAEMREYGAAVWRTATLVSRELGHTEDWKRTEVTGPEGSQPIPVLPGLPNRPATRRSRAAWPGPSS
jgi:DNA-binding IclR family transcriptional regulator